MNPKGHWVWLDDETCDTLMAACALVMDDCREQPSPAREINQTWALWMTIVLCTHEPRPYISASTEELLNGLRGLLSPAAFDHATASHRLTWPSGWACQAPPSHAGKLVALGPRSDTSEPWTVYEDA